MKKEKVQGLDALKGKYADAGKIEQEILAHMDRYGLPLEKAYRAAGGTGLTHDQQRALQKRSQATASGFAPGQTPREKVRSTIDALEQIRKERSAEAQGV